MKITPCALGRRRSLRGLFQPGIPSPEQKLRGRSVGSGQTRPGHAWGCRALGASAPAREGEARRALGARALPPSPARPRADPARPGAGGNPGVSGGWAPTVPRQLRPPRELRARGSRSRGRSGSASLYLRAEGRPEKPWGAVGRTGARAGLRGLGDRAGERERRDGGSGRPCSSDAAAAHPRGAARPSSCSTSTASQTLRGVLLALTSCFGN